MSCKGRVGPFATPSDGGGALLIVAVSVLALAVVAGAAFGYYLWSQEPFEETDLAYAEEVLEANGLGAADVTAEGGQVSVTFGYPSPFPRPWTNIDNAGTANQMAAAALVWQALPTPAEAVCLQYQESRPAQVCVEREQLQTSGVTPGSDVAIESAADLGLVNRFGCPLDSTTSPSGSPLQQADESCLLFGAVDAVCGLDYATPLPTVIEGSPWSATFVAPMEKPGRWARVSTGTSADPRSRQVLRVSCAGDPTTVVTTDQWQAFSSVGCSQVYGASGLPVTLGCATDQTPKASQKDDTRGEGPFRPLAERPPIGHPLSNVSGARYIRAVDHGCPPWAPAQVDSVTWADVSSDGLDEAFVFTSCAYLTSGAGGQRVHVVMADDLGDPQVIGLLALATPGAYGQIEVNGATVLVSGSTITLTGVTFGPNDPNCCPSTDVNETFVFKDGRVVNVKDR